MVPSAFQYIESPVNPLSLKLLNNVIGDCLDLNAKPRQTEYEYSIRAIVKLATRGVIK